MRKSNRPIWQRPSTWIAAPLLIVAAGITWLVTREALAAADVRSQLAEMRNAGRAVDNATLEANYEASTHKEGTNDWNEAIRLLCNMPASAAADDLPYVGGGTHTQELDPNQDWVHEPAAAKLLSRLAPAIDKLHAATRHPKPTWHPIHFNGLNTYLSALQNARTAVSVLQLDAEYSIRTGDTQRALRSIQDIYQVAEAYDTQFFSFCSYYAVNIRLSANASIRRSLYASVWSDEQLTTLRDLIATPLDIASGWPQLIDANLAATLASMDDPTQQPTRPSESLAQSWLTQLPSSKKSFIDETQAWRSIGDNDLKAMQASAERLEYHQNLAASHNTLPTVEQAIYHYYGTMPSIIIRAYKRLEDSRRFTTLALAIKQYQLREARWPKSLQQLASLEPAILGGLTTDGVRFGYQVDGDRAIVWTYDQRNEISSTPPTPAPDDSPLDIHSNLAVIR